MTAVKAAEVERALAQRSPAIRCLLFYGSDPGLVAERARVAAIGAVDEAQDPFQLVRLDGDTVADQPGRLADEVSTYGLFGGRRAIWVRPTSRAITPAVAAALDVPGDATLLVVEAGDLGRTSPLRSLCEASPRALALPCYNDESRDLGPLVDTALRASGLQIERDARDLLLEALGGDRLASRGELEKLTLYGHGQATISLGDVEAVISDVSALNIDSVVDAAFEGDLDGLDAGLLQLWARGINPAALLALALRHALALSDRALLMGEGADPGQLVRTWRGLQFRRQRSVTRQLSRWSPRTASQALARLQNATLASRRGPALAQALASDTLRRIAELARTGSGRL